MTPGAVRTLCGIVPLHEGKKPVLKRCSWPSSRKCRRLLMTDADCAESPNPRSPKQVAWKDMNLASFSNMDAWVQGLNKQIEQRPRGRPGRQAGAKEPFVMEAG